MPTKLTNNNPDCGVLSITLNDVCNFKCSYCSPIHNDGKYRWPDDNAFDTYLEIADEMLLKNKYLLVNLLGGEPTLWPRLVEFLRRLERDSIITQISTNASRTLRYWRDFPKISGTEIFFSWHNEFIDDEHYLNVLEIMQDKVACLAAIQFTPETFDRAKKLYDIIVDKQLKVYASPKITRVNINSSDKMKFTEDQLNWLLENSYNYNNMISVQRSWEVPWKIYINGNEINPKINYFDFREWKCQAGIKSIYIAADGSVQRCNSGAPLFNKNENLGNINTMWYLPDTPYICDIDCCLCEIDVIIEKETDWKFIKRV